jgi:surfeit locus 1 family protein
MISHSRSSERPALRFRPRLWPTLAALAGMSLLLALGTWQLQRLHWKESLIAKREASLAMPLAPLPPAADDWRAFDFRHVVLEGSFRHEKEQLFGFSARVGQPGHHLLTPLVRPDGSAVLVDRGWIPADKAHPASRREGQVEGAIELSGIARYRGDEAPSWLRPDNRPEEGLWYWYDTLAFERATGLDLLPVVVQAGPEPNPGGLPVPDAGIPPLPNNHLQYAVTWYGLALTLLAVYLAFSIERRER